MYRGTDIDIHSAEAFEAVQRMLTFLQTDCKIKSAGDALNQVIFSYGDEYSTCYDCGDINSECRCGSKCRDLYEDDYYDRYADFIDGENNG